MNKLIETTLVATMILRMYSADVSAARLQNIYSYCAQVVTDNMRGPTPAEEYLLNRTNEQRAAEGAQPLAWSDVLGKTAYDHSAWLLANDQFVHSPDLVGDVGRAGWEWRAGKYSFFENHGWGAPTTTNQQALAEQQFQGYLSSPEHHANMVNPNHEMFGASIQTGEFAGNQDAHVSTEHFGYNERRPFLTGQVQTDKIGTGNNDGGKYDIGEGLGCVTIVSEDVATGQKITTASRDTGGYEMELDPKHTYKVTVGFNDPIQITMGVLNIEKDFLDPKLTARPFINSP